MQPLPSAGSSITKRAKPFTIALAVLTLLLIAVLALTLFLDALQWHERGETPAASASGLSDEEKILQQKLSSYERSADQLKTISSLILGLSTLFGLALGVNAYINLKETKEQYESEIKRIKQSLDGELLAIHHDFPLFRGMHHSITSINVKLREFIPDSDYGRDEMSRISVGDRMMVHYFERVVATFEFFDLGPFKSEACKIYTMMGSYYAHKYSHEQTVYRKTKASNPGASLTPPVREDLERARLYLRKAVSVQPDNYLPRNEIGFLEVIVADEPANALADLMTSIDHYPNQQRARYYLSIIQHQLGVGLIAADRSRAIQHFEKSTAQLDEALDQDHWQTTKPRLRYFKSMHYNYACASARLGDLESDTAEKETHYKAALEHLKKCIPLTKEDALLKESLDGDSAAGGDFEMLGKEQNLGAEFAQLVKQLRG